MFADVTSANTVGYMNKNSEVGGYTYVAPMFIQVDGEESVDLQDIQMAADVPPEGAFIDVRDDAEGLVHEYYWYQKITLEGPTKGKAGPDGFEQTVSEGKNGLWIEWVYTYIEPEFDPETWEITGGDSFEFDHFDYPESGTDKEVRFDYGNGFLMQLNDPSYKVQFVGAVSDVTMYFPNMVGGYNYIGNPFASAIDLQNIQMAATVPPEGAFIDIRDDAEGLVNEYYWYQKITLEGPTKGKAGPDGFEQTVPEGKNGLWIEWVYTYIEPEFDPETWEITGGDSFEFDHFDYPQSGTEKQVNFEAGEGFLLQLNDETYECFLNAPYEL